MKENAKKGADRAYYKLRKIKEKNSNPRCVSKNIVQLKLELLN